MSISNEEREEAYQKEVIGYAVHIPIMGAERVKQVFYYCVAHRSMGIVGDIEIRSVTREDEGDFPVVCQLCHQPLRSIAYLLKEIARRDETRNEQ